VERLQLCDRFTAIRDHERPTLTDLLQVPAKSSFQFTDANGRASSHVVMMTTIDLIVNSQHLLRPDDWLAVRNDFRNWFVRNAA